jgi:hypothetical protein
VLEGKHETSDPARSHPGTLTPLRANQAFPFAESVGNKVKSHLGEGRVIRRITGKLAQPFARHGRKHQAH